MKLELEGAISPPGVYGITALGYPVYFLTLLGFWKVVGVIILLVPKYPLAKEWAYAGFFILLTSAIYSHLAVGHAVKELFPSALLLILTCLSWYFRPTSRKLVAVNL